ncbi:MAG TPA: ribonuclease II, partial [Betaproteobacteria bacterium]|nr:ribonuclease II [Betaproteobacteria bacterium]
LLKPLLYQPDKNSLAYKALEKACAAAQLPPHRLLERCGAIPSSRAYHLERFLFEHFPKGAALAAAGVSPPPPLPASDVLAFSIDDAATTEIDDAFSVTPLANGNVRIGIHIAVPGLGVAPGSPLDEIARERLSTVYMPGDKLTMLPESVVGQFTLQRGRRCPALSFYVETTPDEYGVVTSETRLEEITVGENLRIETLQPLFNEETLRQGLADFPWRQELHTLWRFADTLEERRGRPDAGKTFPQEFGFHIDNGRVSIIRRQRGTPIDKLVSELMIFVNSQWAETLRQNGLSAVFRAQNGGKVRMTTAPGPHQGLGVSLYMWASSPLRRYIDLMNQRQLVAWARGETPPYEENSEAMLGAMHGFDLAYGAYQAFQRQMERYWSLRYLTQEQIAVAPAMVHRENLVRLQLAPLMMRVPGLPELPPGSVVEVQIGGVDLLDLEFTSKFKRVVTEAGGG